MFDAFNHSLNDVDVNFYQLFFELRSQLFFGFVFPPIFVNTSLLKISQKFSICRVSVQIWCFSISDNRSSFSHNVKKSGENLASSFLCCFWQKFNLEFNHFRPFYTEFTVWPRIDPLNASETPTDEIANQAAQY